MFEEETTTPEVVAEVTEETEVEAVATEEETPAA